MKAQMKIAITGASGFVGKLLVPLLADAGASLLLIGRSPAQLARLFPDQPSCDYAALVDRAQGFDVLLNLAVLNSSADMPAEMFRAVNVDLACNLAQSAEQAGIRRFVNTSSIHALDLRNISGYASSKRAAEARLAELCGAEATTVHLATVYGRRWSGRLGWLNRFPAPLAHLLFRPLAALKPTVHIQRLADFLLNPPTSGTGQIILADDQDNNLCYRTTKRLIDLLFALAVLLLLGWAMVLIWVLVRLQSPGPGIFAQPRVGRNGKIFICYKFRSMKTGTLQAGTHDVSAAAVTRFGAFLRRSKLDELPQAWNILRNQMSLIGPRPCLPVQSALVAEREARGVLRLKPGISGLAQVAGIDMRDPVRLARRDARYMALRGLVPEFKIILATLRAPRE